MLGVETVENHPCVKSKVTITPDSGKKIEMFVWQATDLKLIPVKTEMTSDLGLATSCLRNIKLGKPDASLFSPPSDYTKYDSVQAMMMQSMMRNMRNVKSQEETEISRQITPEQGTTPNPPQETQSKKRSWIPQLPKIPQIPRIPGSSE
jgi:hypothetical protein